MRKVKILYLYYLTIVCFSIIAIIFLPKPTKNFIPIIVLFNGPILFFISFNINYNLSQKIKTKYPEIFKKYKYDNGFSMISGEIISILNYYNNSDFEKFENELKEDCNLIKKMFLLSISCFVIGSLLAVSTVYA
jgi:hypothetical protein